MANNNLSAVGVVVPVVLGLVLSWYAPMFGVGLFLGIIVGAVWVRHDVIVAKREGRLIQVDSQKN